MSATLEASGIVLLALIAPTQVFETCSVLVAELAGYHDDLPCTAVEPPPGQCEDGVCDTDVGEDCNTCPGDCGQCPPRCGDGECNGDEKCDTCQPDCGYCPSVCGDGTCSGNETWSYCPQDCDMIVCGHISCGDQPCANCINICGDGNCTRNSTYTETFHNCPADCVEPTCGDHICNAAETCLSCPRDCGLCSGDYQCSEQYCVPPDCWCARPYPPINLAHDDTPQFVMLTWDDAIEASSVESAWFSYERISHVQSYDVLGQGYA